MYITEKGDNTDLENGKKKEWPRRCCNVTEDRERKRQTHITTRIIMIE